jgi:hypothetical protein
MRILNVSLPNARAWPTVTGVFGVIESGKKVDESLELKLMRQEVSHRETHLEHRFRADSRAIFVRFERHLQVMLNAIFIYLVRHLHVMSSAISIHFEHHRRCLTDSRR